jgi:glycosyltransferase involved in cell wall biosynthesis
MGAHMTARPRIGYVPYGASAAHHPADIRRFVTYAKARNLPYEVARPDQRYDVVVLNETSDISVWSEYQGGKIVFDFIDSYLAIPRTDPKQLLRGLVWYANGRHSRLRLDFKGALQTMCRRADAVVCTTDEQRGDISVFCPNVHIILDIHDNVIRSRKQDYTASSPFNLVWEGLPSNISQLSAIGSVLREISQHRSVVLHIVTDVDRPGAMPYLPRIKSADVVRGIFENVVLHRWDETTLSTIITQGDIAIIPIFTGDPLTRGKPSNKLALLWRMGMPVVTSATPSYRHMQNAAGTGFLACDSDADWTAALDRLMTSEPVRREAGERGYAYVTEHFNTDRLLSLWDNVFASIGFDFRPGHQGN